GGGFRAARDRARMAQRSPFAVERVGPTRYAGRARSSPDLDGHPEGSLRRNGAGGVDDVAVAKNGAPGFSEFRKFETRSRETSTKSKWWPQRDSHPCFHAAARFAGELATCGATPFVGVMGTETRCSIAWPA